MLLKELALYFIRQSFRICAYEYRPQNAFTFALNRVLNRFSKSVIFFWKMQIYVHMSIDLKMHLRSH